MTNAPEGAFKIPNFIDQLELAKFGWQGFCVFVITRISLSHKKLRKSEILRALFHPQFPED